MMKNNAARIVAELLREMNLDIGRMSCEEHDKLEKELNEEGEFALAKLKSAADSGSNNECSRFYVIFLACESLNVCHSVCAQKQLESIRFMLHGDSSIKAGDVA